MCKMRKLELGLLVASDRNQPRLAFLPRTCRGTASCVSGPRDPNTVLSAKWLSLSRLSSVHLKGPCTRGPLIPPGRDLQLRNPRGKRHFSPHSNYESIRLTGLWFDWPGLGHKPPEPITSTGLCGLALSRHKHALTAPIEGLVSALHGPHGREQGRETPQRETQKMLPGDRTAAGQAEATYQHACTLLAWNSPRHEGFLASPIRWIVRTWQESPSFIQFSDPAYSCPADWASPLPLLLRWAPRICWSRG